MEPEKKEQKTDVTEQTADAPETLVDEPETPTDVTRIPAEAPKPSVDVPETGEQTGQAQEPDQPKLRGLYRNVKVSVRTLNIVIVVGIVAIVVCVLFGVSHNGYTVTFDANGGTDVETQTCMYNESVALPEEPTREGYTFAGWYADENCTQVWDFSADTVTASMTLYAKWTENES